MEWRKQLWREFDRIQTILQNIRDKTQKEEGKRGKKLRQTVTKGEENSKKVIFNNNYFN